MLRARLTGATYHPDNTPQQCKDLSDEIRTKFKEEPWSDRYRYVVQVFLGEQKGEGIRCVHWPPPAVAIHGTRSC